MEMDLPEDKVLEKLNKVSTAKRQAYMVSMQRTGSYMESNIASQELFDTKFGQREKINKAKAARKHS